MEEEYCQQSYVRCDETVRYGGPGSFMDTDIGRHSKFSTPRAKLYDYSHHDSAPSSGGVGSGWGAPSGGGDYRKDEIFTQPFFVSTSLQQTQKWIAQKCQMLSQAGVLYEDPYFPATDKSLYYSRRGTSYRWRRPKEINPNAEFIVKGASRFDIRQGELGDCWLLAAVASLSLHPAMVDQVIPEGQSMSSRNYCGMFVFRFWQFGVWINVLVDDRLPTSGGSLVYMHSTESSEFWSALLEKAYAKLNGSYESLKGGSTTEAMEDFTGGISELFEMTESEQPPPNLYDIMLRANSRRSLMGCSIEAEDGQIEAKGELGLIKGHAYSITDVRQVRTRRGTANLVRIRNPWGNEDEWRGRWSDQSTEWNEIGESERRRLGIQFEDDGEFWMEFEDFKHYFTKLEICHLNPESDQVGGKKRSWSAKVQEGEWKRNTTAGGCRNFIATFHMNPQFRVTVVDPDEDDDDAKGTLIVGLMQKGMRQKRSDGIEMYTIGYAIYECPSNQQGPLDTKFFRFHASVAKSPSFINLREVCGRHKLNPGEYVIIPSTFQANEEAQFILRIFSEQPHKAEEIDDVTSMEDVEDSNTPTDENTTNRLRQAFSAIAGEDMEIDTFELRDILNAAFRNEFRFEGFSVETCRSMISMMDVDQSGKLGFDEFKKLWQDLRLWKTVFKKFDVDRSTTLNSYELRNVLTQVGFHVSNVIFNSITTRYTNKAGVILFDDFIVLLVRMKTIFQTFKAQEKTRDGKAIFSADDFIRSVVYV